MRTFLKLYSLPLIIVLIGLSAYFIAYIVFIVLADNENFDLPNLPPQATHSLNESNHLDSAPSPATPTQKAIESHLNAPTQEIPKEAQEPTPTAPSENNSIDSTKIPQNTQNLPQESITRFVIARSNVRKAPTKDAQIITKANEGEPITLLEDLGEWSKIRTQSRVVGYIATQLLKERLSETYRIIADKLNVRASANEKARILTRLPQNTRVEVLSIENTKWAKIMLPNSQQGFVALEFLTKE